MCLITKMLNHEIFKILHSTRGNALVSFKNKLKEVEARLKNWHKDMVRNIDIERKNLVEKLDRIDTLLDDGTFNQTLVETRIDTMKSTQDLDERSRLDDAQKIKRNWDMDGDKNSKFFHNFVKKQRHKLMVSGILKDGQKFQRARFLYPNERFKKLDSCSGESLVSAITLEEIKDVVWSCGGDRAPGPDGFLFKFVKTYWEMMKNDIFDFVQEFVTSGNILIGCNSSFITLIPKVTSLILCKDYRPISLIGLQYKIISKLLANRIAKVIEGVISVEQSAFIKGRQILDGPLVVNEVIEWYKKRKKKGLVFKVDFDKAYDSMSWDYILNVMVCMGFPAKWLNWIKGCLSSSRASILVNGSPTKEFSLEQGLRQGDTLSPFLFIIAMEGLHVAMDTAMDHGCAAARIPFRYLGLPVGSNIRRIQNWNEIIQRVKHMLSKWKVNLLLIGVRAISFYILLRGRCNDRKISWLNWDSVLNERDKGGLGISSLKASNLALLYKWRWRFMNDHDSKWVKVIKSIHGRDGGFGTSDWKPV
ncbi:putative RNA-directed DNA polymerase, eukaryota, reverse transcriptase zinc-binding domain protein, partial [Tanacetum coccineum]